MAESTTSLHPKKRWRRSDPSCLQGDDGARREVPISNRGPNNSSGEKRIRTHENTDQWSIASRSSIRNVYDAVSSFNEEKRGLIRSIGFTGLLNFPPIKQMNRKLNVYLLPRVDAVGRALKTGGGKKLAMSSLDVHKVFGIPNGGTSISNMGMPTKETVRKISTEYLGMGLKDTRSIKNAQEIVEKDYSGSMTEDEQESFKAAFVVYIMSTLLAPGARADYVSVDYWNALKEPSKIGEYNWCEYVLEKLMDGVVKLKADIKSQAKSPSITGCTLFLQIFYLDSLELGELKMEHDVFPRITCFDTEKMKYMIRADSMEDEGNTGECCFGKSKVRSPRGCCYTWAATTQHSTSKIKESKSTDLWNSTISLAKSLKVPLEAAAPLFHGIAEVEDIVANNNPVSLLWLVSTILRIIEPYKEGFSYSAGRQCRDKGDDTTASSSSSRSVDVVGRPKILDAQGTSSYVDGEQQAYGSTNADGLVHIHRCNCPYLRMKHGGAAETINTKPDVTVGNYELQTHVAITAMAKYYLCDRAEKYSVVSPVTTHDSLDSPGKNKRSDMTCSMFQSKTPTPWQIAVQMKRAAVKTAYIWDVLKVKYNTVFNTREPLISHHTPKYIEVLTSSARDQIVGDSEMEMDLFDAILRRLKQCDDAVYSEKWMQRRRHYIETDFMESLIAGWFNPDDPAMKTQFIGDHIKYDVRDCKVLFFPALVEHRWVCYTWRMDVNIIYIFDPMGHGSAEEWTSTCHLMITSKLKAAINAIASKHFDVWRHDFEGATAELLDRPEDLQRRHNRSGVLCANFCHIYGDISFDTPLSEMDIDMKATMLLMEVTQLTGNRGKIPRDLL